MRRALFILTNPGVLAVFLYRIQQALQHSRLRPMSNFVCAMNHFITGAEFVPGCEIEGGLVLRHPSGVVIGSGVRIGSDCIMQHGVTVGERYVDSKSDGRYPVIGNHVVIGTQAVILGEIFIGDSATVGAQTLVTRDVPEGRTVVGRNELT